MTSSLVAKKSKITGQGQVKDPAWDKTTYRIRFIPREYTRLRLSLVLTAILGEGLSEAEVKIHSLASFGDVNPYNGVATGEPVDKVATVSFRRRPSSLPPPDEEWHFARFKDDETGHELSLVVDTRFNNFTPLSFLDEAGGSEDAEDIDCIAIHGLGGHAFGSFRSFSPNSTYMWLRDSLPQHFPQLRVWIYGYESSLRDPDSLADVDEYAENFRWHLRDLRVRTGANEKRRPIIYLVHSLGGCIFKQAVIAMAHSEDQSDRINLQCTYGALFFGVPNQGMDVEAMATMVGNRPGRYTLDLLNQQLGYRLKSRQHDEFCKAFSFRDSRIIQFFEQQKSPTVHENPDTQEWSQTGECRLLVTPSSATGARSWETGNEYNVSLHGNHSTMVKFTKSDLDNYQKVRYVLQSFVGRATTVIQKRMQNVYVSTSPPDNNVDSPVELSPEEPASPQPLPYHENGTVNITARPSTPVTIYNAPGPLYISSSYLFTVKEPPRPLPAMARHYDRETLLMERIKDKTIPSSLEQDGLSQDIQSFCIPLFGTTNVKIKQQLEKWRDKKYKDERTWPRLEGFKNATLQVVGWVRDQSHACQVRVVFCVFDKSKRDVTKYSLLRWDEVMFKVICFSSAEGETLRKMFSDKWCRLHQGEPSADSILLALTPDSGPMTSKKYAQADQPCERVTEDNGLQHAHAHNCTGFFRCAEANTAAVEALFDALIGYSAAAVLSGLRRQQQMTT